MVDGILVEERLSELRVGVTPVDRGQYAAEAVRL